jgi:hypothetical protein
MLSGPDGLDLMAPQTSEITLPKVRLDLDDLLAVIQNLDEASRARVARVLAETEMEARWKTLIAQLAARAPADDLTDADIDREVRAVRARPA